MTRNVQQLNETMDAMIVKGDIIAAFEQFAADNCVTMSSPQDITRSKAQKTDALRAFFQNIATINRIDLLATRIAAPLSESQFWFHFTNRQGEDLVFQEVIRRVWENGQVAEEQYLMGQSIETGVPEAAATPKKTAAKKTTVAENKPEPATVAKEEAPAKKTTAKKTTASKTSKK